MSGVSFSFGVIGKRDGEDRQGKIYGKACVKIEDNFPFAREGEIVVKIKMSVVRVVFTKNGVIQKILQKPFLPDFTKHYFVATYASLKDLKIPEDEEEERKMATQFFDRFQEEFTKEIIEVFKKT